MKIPPQYIIEFSAAAGSLVSLSFINKITLGNAISSLMCGFACAYFFTPPLIEWRHMSKDEAGALGFLFGLVGFCLASAVYNVFSSMRDWLPGLVKTIIERKTGGGNG